LPLDEPAVERHNDWFGQSNHERKRTMLYSGLCSVTFRKMTAVQIVELAAKAGLAGIEWGGDVHVPHGQVEIARQVKDLTAAAGLEIPSYGSYYKVAESEKAGLAFAAVADSAAALGAKTIRVWAGGKHSKDADAEYRKSVEDDSRRIASIAGQRGMTVSYEFHAGTLTDTAESAVALLTAVDAAGLKTYWQPALKYTHN
jgi:sugar phosphate isomerase/epimerase